MTGAKGWEQERERKIDFVVMFENGKARSKQG